MEDSIRSGITTKSFYSSKMELWVKEWMNFLHEALGIYVACFYRLIPSYNLSAPILLESLLET